MSLCENISSSIKEPLFGGLFGLLSSPSFFSDSSATVSAVLLLAAITVRTVSEHHTFIHALFVFVERVSLTLSLSLYFLIF